MNDNLFGTAGKCDQVQEPLTYEKFRECFGKMPPEPVAEWMKEQGCDPAKGGRLFWPHAERDRLGSWLPSYVVVSKFITEPILCNPNYKKPEPLKVMGYFGSVLKHPASLIKTDMV